MTAYAVFKTADAASKCLALDGTILEGKHLRVDRIDGENGGKLDYKRTIFVGNLPFTADEDDVRSFFNGLRWGSGDSAGAAVEAVRIVRDRVTHKGKGIAFVLFSDRAHVVTALGLGEKASYKGRALRIERCSADGKAGGAAKKTKIEAKVAPRYQGSTGDATAKVSAGKSTKRGEPTKKKFFKRRY
jgi:RNA recognition motif-containing protein